MGLSTGGFYPPTSLRRLGCLNEAPGSSPPHRYGFAIVGDVEKYEIIFIRNEENVNVICRSTPTATRKIPLFDVDITSLVPT